MLLSQYQATLQNLIQAPTSPVPLIPLNILTQYINLARAQVALDAECVRGSGTATIGGGVAVIPITAFAPGLTGVAQAIVIRNARLNSSRVDVRPWDWFENYYLAGPPVSVPPRPTIAHQGQGAFSTIYLYSPAGGSLLADLVFLPINLASDTDPDAIPYPWTDAVPFWAAFYSYMTMQRQADANVFFQRYSELTRRGRTTTTSTMLPENDPGGLGAVVATTKTPLGAPRPQPAARGGG